MLCRSFLCALTFDNMASKGLRAISNQVTREVEAGYNPSHTTETLIGYIVCCVLVFILHIQSKVHLNQIDYIHLVHQKSKSSDIVDY
jgi:hypothetical protein